MKRLLVLNKLHIAAAAAALVVVVGVVGSAAFFTGGAKTTNVITTGSVSIELQEFTENDGIFSVFHNKENIMPGTSVSKVVQIKNNGNNDAYVRIQVSKDITLAEGREGDVDTGIMQLDYNEDNWTLQEEDGSEFWYYNEPLEVGETTEPLFTTVSFSESIGNLYQGCRTEVKVDAQAVQVKNNDKNGALGAAGWPAVE